MLFNREIWYNLTRNDVKELENVDRMFLNYLMKSKLTTPKEAIYLELSILPIQMILKQRRMNYLYYLLQTKENSMLGDFFQV